MRSQHLNINWDLFLCLSISLITLLLYLPIRTFDFVNFDDPLYVFENPMMRFGFTRKSISWAFTSFHGSNWHPLTWLSHMADCHFFGLNAGQHHINNLILHIFNSLLLFINLNVMTQKRIHSALVALFFAIHPIHVESVAWISERKDLLSTFFLMLSLRYYIFFTKGYGWKNYFLVLFFYIMGLMSKPMIVTFPFLLLLLDFWPLNRERKIISLITEKIPLFTLSLISCVVTFIAQSRGGSVVSLTIFSFYDRVANASISYVMYIFNMTWPLKLVFFYPYRENISWWMMGSALFLLTIFTVYAIKSYQKYPQILVGWLWYLGTLVPVIGLVQVGLQGMADRYTYIPSIGLFIIWVWMLIELEKKAKLRPIFLWGVLGVLFMGAITLSHRQIGFWRNTYPLFGWALKIYPENHIVHFYMAGTYYNVKQYDAALIHLKKTIEIAPEYSHASRYMGDIYTHFKEFDQADYYYLRELKINPNGIHTYVGLGNLQLAKGDLVKSIEFYDKAININSKSALAHNNIGLALLRLGKIGKCIEYFRKAVLYAPYDIQFKNNYKKAQIVNHHIKSTASEIKDLFKEMATGSADVKKAAKDLIAQKSDLDGIFQEYQNALKIQPGYQPVKILDIAPIAEIKLQYESKLSQFIEMDKAFPNTPEIAFHIACILARKRAYDKTFEWLKKAIEYGFEDIDSIENDSDLNDFRDSSYYSKLKLRKKHF